MPLYENDAPRDKDGPVQIDRLRMGRTMKVVAGTILVTGALLLIACVALIIRVEEVHTEQEKGRENICTARELDGLEQTPICREFMKNRGF